MENVRHSTKGEMRAAKLMRDTGCSLVTLYRLLRTGQSSNAGKPDVDWLSHDTQSRRKVTGLPRDGDIMG